MPDTSRIGVALLTTLQADAALLALMPDGVHRAVAPAGKTRYVIVSLVIAPDQAIFEGRGAVDALYLVQARALSSSGGNVYAAAARIDELLHLGTLTIAGHHLLVMRRVEYVEDVEHDEADASLLWNRCGGRYQVMAAPIGT